MFNCQMQRNIWLEDVSLAFMSPTPRICNWPKIPVLLGLKDFFIQETGMFDVDDVPLECSSVDGSTGFMSILFNFIDKDSDGCLTKKELKKAIKKIRNQCWTASTYLKYYIDYHNMNGQTPKVHNQHSLKTHSILKYDSPTVTHGKIFVYEFCVLWITV